MYAMGMAKKCTGLYMYVYLENSLLYICLGIGEL